MVNSAVEEEHVRGRFVDADQEISQSSSSEGELGSGVLDGFSLVFLSKGNSILNAVIDIFYRNREGFSVPKVGWSVIVLLWVFRDNTSGKVSQFGPVGRGERKLEVIWLSVDNRVPNSVKVAGSVNRWKFDSVSSEVSTWVVVVYSGGSVEWLVHISSVVDEQSEGSGLGVVLSGFSVSVGHDFLVGVLLGVVAFFLEPVSDAWHDHGDVVHVFHEAVVAQGSTLVEVGVVNEMPVLLV